MPSSKLILLLLLSNSLIQSGCVVPLVATGAATGAVVAQDRRTTGTMVDDQTLSIKAMHRLSQDPGLSEQSHIHVISYNNILLLVGQTTSENFKQIAQTALSELPKVRAIHNELTIGPPSTLAVRTQDSWITTQVKSKMLANETLRFTPIKVITENSTVYLLGLVSSQEEEEALEIARSIPEVEKVIHFFEKTE